MSAMYHEAFLERLREGAAGLVHEWGLSGDTSVQLLEISENATFRADDPHAAGAVVLRVHRPGYRGVAEIESELAWIQALRAEGIVSTPRPLECASGGHIATFSTDGGLREVVAFEFMSGRQPSATDDLVRGFHDLGVVSARLHGHSRKWARPPGFTRKSWNFATTIGDTPLWGDWRAGLGLSTKGRKVLEQTASRLEAHINEYGTGVDRFGLIHADLRLANLLVDGDRIAVIDFDDCGFGWFGFDFAAAVSFIEDDPRIPELMASWVDGYRTVAPLADADRAMLPVFVMLRRLQLTAWVASHSETPTAQRMGADFTEGTVRLARDFLSQ
jgi:Ser/Thr protein kinase RdoA (MazF antagonist)